jgi:S1-C subfamily serine protease
VLVNSVVEGGAAEKAGLEKGDVILKIDDAAVDSKAGFDEEIAYRDPGANVRVTFRRGTKLKEAICLLTNKEGTTEKIKREVFTSGRRGAEMEAISKVERDRFKVESGVRIVKITNRGFFSQYGFEEGFIITMVNNQKCNSPEDVEELLGNTRGKVLLEGINRQGSKGVYQFFSY